MSDGSGADERAWAADRRDFVADLRDAVAAERERVAEARDRTVDAREAELDEWESAVDARAAEQADQVQGFESAVEGAEAYSARSQGQQSRDSEHEVFSPFDHYFPNTGLKHFVETTAEAEGVVNRSIAEGYEAPAEPLMQGSVVHMQTHAFGDDRGDDRRACGVGKTCRDRVVAVTTTPADPRRDSSGGAGRADQSGR